MDITIHGGNGRIGASCIEVSSRATRIILDCGWPLEGEAPFPAPAVSGLFQPATSAPGALLLTHGHLDHTGFIRQIAPNIPVYATMDASKVMKVGSIYAGGVAIPAERFREVPIPRHRREQVCPFQIGDLTITAYPVDHSSPGVVGYLIEHKDRRIFYTGDLRFHGRKPSMHQRILRDLTGHIDTLLSEGTNVGRASSGLATERLVEERALTVARASPSLVLATYSPQNLDRFVSFYRAAIRSGRTFVCDHYQAAVLHQLTLPAETLTRRSARLPAESPEAHRKVRAWISIVRHPAG